jgi:hypothetical protein
MEWGVYLMFIRTVRTDLSTSWNVCTLALSTNTNTHTKKCVSNNGFEGIDGGPALPDEI